MSILSMIENLTRMVQPPACMREIERLTTAMRGWFPTFDFGMDLIPKTTYFDRFGNEIGNPFAGFSYSKLAAFWPDLDHVPDHLNLVKLEVLDYSIKALSLNAKEAEKLHDDVADAPDLIGNGLSWFKLAKSLKEARKRLSKRKIKKLIATLKMLRRAYLEAHEPIKTKCRKLLNCRLRKQLHQATYCLVAALLKCRCCAESFCLGTASEFKRSGHFLTSKYRTASQLWSRVIAAFRDQVSEVAITRNQLVAMT